MAQLKRSLRKGIVSRYSFKEFIEDIFKGGDSSQVVPLHWQHHWWFEHQEAMRWSSYPLMLKASPDVNTRDENLAYRGIGVTKLGTRS